MGPGLPGTTGNYWTSGSSFPASTPWIMYLGPNNTLTPTLPTNDGTYTYNYDPTDPAPTIGGNNLLMICGPWQQVGTPYGLGHLFIINSD